MDSKGGVEYVPSTILELSNNAHYSNICRRLTAVLLYVCFPNLILESNSFEHAASITLDFSRIHPDQWSMA